MGIFADLSTIENGRTRKHHADGFEDFDRGTVPKRKRTKSMSGFLAGMMKIGRLTGPEVAECANASCALVASSGGQLGLDVMPIELKSWAANTRDEDHAHRNILASMSKQSDMPDLYEADICTWNSIRGERESTKCSFSLPYEIVEKDLEVGDIALSDYILFASRYPTSPSMGNVLYEVTGRAEASERGKKE